MLCASDFKVHLPITVFPKSSLHAEAHFTFLPKSSLQPLSKGSDKYVLFDPIAVQMYVMGTLPGKVTYKPTLQAKGSPLPDRQSSRSKIRGSRLWCEVLPDALCVVLLKILQELQPVQLELCRTMPAGLWRCSWSSRTSSLEPSSQRPW